MCRDTSTVEFEQPQIDWLCRRSLAGDPLDDFEDRELWWMLGVLDRVLDDLEAKIDRGHFDADLSAEIDRVTLVQEHVGCVLKHRLYLPQAA